MYSDLERIAGKVANAPRPPLPGGIVEEVPKADSDDMLATRAETGEGTYLPAGVVIEYKDANGNWSCRRITLLSARPEGADASLVGFCHLRQDARRFRLDGLARILDPHGGVLDYATPQAFLEHFRVDTPDEGPGADLRALLRAARHELTVLMFFSRCDGYLHPAERGVMLDYIAQTYGDDAGNPDDLWELVRRLYPDSETMLSSARALMNQDGPEVLSSLRDSIRRLIEADGIIHNDEALHAIELAHLGD